MFYWQAQLLWHFYPLPMFPLFFIIIIQQKHEDIGYLKYHIPFLLKSCFFLKSWNPAWAAAGKVSGTVYQIYNDTKDWSKPKQ